MFLLSHRNEGIKDASHSWVWWLTPVIQPLAKVGWGGAGQV